MPVNVNFMVDMSNETVSSNGIHLAGAFQGWDPSSTEMLMKMEMVFMRFH